MSFVKNLEVRLLLEKNYSVLYTQRNRAQSWILFLSSLGGSIIGLLGTLGVIMNLFEGHYKSCIERYKRIFDLKDLIRRRIQIKNGNFSIYELFQSKIKYPRVSSREMKSYSNSAITIQIPDYFLDICTVESD